MDTNKLEQQLKKYRIPEPDMEKKEQTKMLLKKTDITFHMTDTQFILGQMGFIRRRVWIGQFAILAIICMVLRTYVMTNTMDYMVLPMFSALTPLLLVFNIEEFARISYRSMLEIEMAAKYSLRKLMLSRLCILGITDLVVLTVFIFLLNMYSGNSLYLIVMYSLIPFNITIIGLLHLLKYQSKGRYDYMALAYTLIVCVVFISVAQTRPVLYSGAYENMWMLVFLLSFGILIKKLLSVWKDAEDCEKFLMYGEG